MAQKPNTKRTWVRGMVQRIGSQALYVGVPRFDPWHDMFP